MKWDNNINLLELYLYGFTKNAIVYDTIRKNWVIIDDINKQNDYKIVGVYTPAKSTSLIPKGTGPWRLFDENCNQTRMLTITSVRLKHSIVHFFDLINFHIFQCLDNEFTCNNGLCIDIAKRCDEKFDCKDKSDEYNCKKVILDEKNYNNDIPPYVSGSNVKIKVSIFLMSVNKIELPSTFDAKFMLQLSWKDYRLVFQDLNEVNILNDETRESIWIPPLVFSNTENNEILKNDEKTIISILKTGQPKFKDHKHLHEAAIFEGNENILSYHRSYQRKIVCNYDLRFYPFDNQVCTIDVEIPTLLQPYIDVFPLETGNLGVSELDQFLITDTEIVVLKNYSLIQCKVFMKRLPWHHLATTYMPILCVMFMGLITLFIDQSHFDAIIMVSLTCMLVMYTLYQSIAQNMPTTAYLKLLDYWLIFGMILPFAVFSILVTWELMDENCKKNAISAMNKQHLYNKGIKPRSFSKKYSSHARWLLPLLTIIFLIAYISVVVSVL